MSDYIVVDGRRQFAPGVITKADASSVGGRGPVSRGTIAILHEAGRGGEPAVPQLCSNPNYLRQLLPPREGYLFGKYAFRPSSNTERIPGGAEKVYLVRTTPATQASLTVPDGAAVSAAVFAALDWGLYGNEIQITIAAGTSSGKKVTVGYDGEDEVFDNIGDFDVFTLKYNPTAGQTVTSMAATVTPLATEGGTPVLSVAYSFARTGGAVAFNPATWMAFDGTITATSAGVGDIVITGVDKATGVVTTETIDPNGASDTTATAFSSVTSIDASAHAAVSVTYTGNAFALDIGTYDTAQKVVDRVNLIGAGLTGPVDPLVGFVAAMLTPTTMACTDLDYAAAVDVNNALGTFAADLYEFIEGVDSEVVSCTRATGAKNLAASLSITALAGGANGVATTASVQAALDAIRDLDTRHVVLMATAAGTADSFAELLEAHVKERAGKYERVGYFGTTTYATKKTDPGVDPGGLFQRTARRNYRGMVFTPQEVRDYDETGTPVWLPPYYTALLAAGCQAGRLNEASVIWATVDVLDVRDYPGAVSGTNWTVANDKEELLEYGCHILEKLPGTGLIRWAADQTCHLSDNNPIYSSQVANESSDLSIQNVRRVVEDLIGFTNVVVTEGRVKDAVDRELGRQVEAKEIKAYERQTIAVIPGGNYFDVSYNFQPAEATKWIVQRAHIRRLSAAA